MTLLTPALVYFERLLLRRTELLFSYGTLQLEPVQRATFGRVLAGTQDTLPGFRLGELEIKSDAVVATSGVATHPIAQATGNPLDLVAGTVFRITPAELAQADAYEVDSYERVRVALSSGTKAWVYAAALALVATSAQATPVVNASVKEYTVTGATETTVRESLDQSPVSPDGKRRVGYTQADIRWQYESRARKGVCRVVSVKVTLTAVTTLPRWDAPPGVPASLRQSWSRFLAALTAHEQGHTDIALKAAQQIEAALWRAPSPKDCTGVNKQLDKLANDLFDTATTAQEKYDDDADHGATQGVKFP